MLTFNGQKFEKINFGQGKMHGWLSVTNHGVRGAITNASPTDHLNFRLGKAASAAAMSQDIPVELVMPRGWTFYPELRTAKA